MKRIIYLLICNLIILGQVSAQNNCTQFGSTNCENGTHTDPDPNHVSPNVNDFKKNTFDWKQQTLPINKSDYLNFAPNGSTPLYNPFYSTAGYLRYVAGGVDSDFEPEDGWELIKQDFGYIYNTSSQVWNGSLIGSYNKPVAYFILYNKYSAKLRIMATTPAQDGNADIIRVNIKLINPNQEWSGLSNYAGYTANGIFVNTAPIATALDKPTSINQASAFASFPSQKQDFFFADFQLSYDPCICLFKSGLHVTFHKISVGDIDLNGKLIGTQANISTIRNSTGGMYGDGDPGEDFYTQFFSEGDEVKSVTQHYADIQKLIGQIQSQAPISDDEKIDQLKTVLKLASLIVAAGGGGADFSKFLKGAADVISKYLDFIVVVQKEDKPATPTVITAYMQATGTVQVSNELVGTDFYLAVPGSCNSQNGPEYGTPDANGVVPNYPMYNETPGLFALLETPHIVAHHKSGKWGGYANIDTDPDGNLIYPSRVMKYVFDFKSTYQLASPNFKYAFNPIVNENKTYIEAAFEFTGMENTYQSTINDARQIYHEVYDRAVYNAELLYFRDEIPRYRTEFFPLECIGNVISTAEFSFQGDQGRYDNAIQQMFARPTFLILNIYYVFDTDEYGVEHVGVQTLKYPLALSTTSTDLENSTHFSRLNVPTDLVIPATAYTTPQTIYSRGTITITGNLTNNSGGIIRIVGENGVVLDGGSLGQNIILDRQSLSDYFCSGTAPLSQLSTAQLNNYCTNNTYQAKNWAARVVSDDPYKREHEDMWVEPFSFDVYPNPAVGNITIEIRSPEEAINSYLEILTPAGNIVSSYQINKTGGKANESVDLTTLAAGVYLVRCTDTKTQFSSTKKLIITK